MHCSSSLLIVYEGDVSVEPECEAGCSLAAEFDSGSSSEAPEHFDMSTLQIEPQPFTHSEEAMGGCVFTSLLMICMTFNFIKNYTVESTVEINGGFQSIYLQHILKSLLI